MSKAAAAKARTRALNALMPDSVKDSGATDEAEHEHDNDDDDANDDDDTATNAAILL